MSEALERELAEARKKIAELEKENAELRQEMGVRMQEAQERRKQLQKSREDLLIKVEQEEEYLTNTLQSKLRELLKEKVEMETQLEIEEEYLTNKLQKRLMEVLQEKASTEQRLEEERALREKYEAICAEATKMKEQLEAREKACDVLKSRNDRLKAQLGSLQRSNFLLEQQVSHDKEQMDQVLHQHAELEQTIEAKEEREFNMTRKRGRSVSLPCKEGKRKADPRHAVDKKPEHVFRGTPVPLLPLPSTSPGGSSPRFGGILSPRIVSPSSSHSKAVPVGIPSPRGMYGSSPSFGSPPIADAFSPFKEKCIKRGSCRLRNSDGAWEMCGLQLFSSGHLMCASLDTGATVRLNLDTVTDMHCGSHESDDDSVPNVVVLKTKLGGFTFAFDTPYERESWESGVRELCPLLS